MMKKIWKILLIYDKKCYLKKEESKKKEQNNIK